MVFVLGFFASAGATKIKPTDLSELVAEADYIVVGKVVKLDMVDAKGKEVVDKNANTGPRSGNTIRYHVLIDKKRTLKGNPKKIPEKLVFPDWPMWIRSLGGMKELYGGVTCIFLLKAPDFSPSSSAQFVRDIDEKSKIERILKKQCPNTTNP